MKIQCSHAIAVDYYIESILKRDYKSEFEAVEALDYSKLSWKKAIQEDNIWLFFTQIFRNVSKREQGWTKWSGARLHGLLVREANKFSSIIRKVFSFLHEKYVWLEKPVQSNSHKFINLLSFSKIMLLVQLAFNGTIQHNT